MATVTVMSGASTEPLGYFATESTLILNEVIPMLLTFSHWVQRNTPRAYQLFSLKCFFFFFFYHLTSLESSKERLRAVETRIIGILGHCFV
jgi:hypothetical protein